MFDCKTLLTEPKNLRFRFLRGSNSGRLSGCVFRKAFFVAIVTIMNALQSGPATAEHLSEFGTLKALKAEGFDPGAEDCIFTSQEFGDLRGELPFSLYGQEPVTFWPRETWWLEPAPQVNDVSIRCADGIGIELASFGFKKNAWPVVGGSFDPNVARVTAVNWVQLQNDIRLYEHTYVEQLDAKRNVIKINRTAFFLCTPNTIVTGYRRIQETNEVGTVLWQECTLNGVKVEIRMDVRRPKNLAHCAVIAHIQDTSQSVTKNERRRSFMSRISGPYCHPLITQGVKAKPLSKFISAIIASIKKE